MSPTSKEIKRLQQQLRQLLRQHEYMGRELDALRQQIVRLQENSAPEELSTPAAPAADVEERAGADRPWWRRADLEKIVGEDLISKLGIAITVIGVAIGVNYAIDHVLLGPLARIILGYLFGLALVAMASYLRAGYTHFSAVLVSGAMAILYFVTYFAYDFYGFFGRGLAFGLMVALTLLTVLAALRYDRAIIAHMGLVGAYAVPFLLGDERGQAVALFSYMAVLNGGILFLAFRKYWTSLYYSAFLLTWLIYSSWFAFRYWTDEPFAAAFLFSSLFFLLFYGTFLAYKARRGLVFGRKTVVFLLLNSFIFYALGYALLSAYPAATGWLGAFTLGNAAVHLLAAYALHRQADADRSLFAFLLGLGLTFLTMAVPVQLNGSWVTLLWAGEAAALFWVGRRLHASAYEKLAYILLLLSVLSLAEDWSTAYERHVGTDEHLRPLLNPYFMTAALVTAVLCFFVGLGRRYPTAIATTTVWHPIGRFLPPMLLLATPYFTFAWEIDLYWQQQYWASATTDPTLGLRYNDDMAGFRSIWLFIYTFAYLSGLGFVNIYRWHHRQLARVNLIANLLALVFFLLIGLYTLSELRLAYRQPDLYYGAGPGHLLIRYVALVFLAVLLFSSFRYLRLGLVGARWLPPLELLLALTLVWVGSSELIHWLDLYGRSANYKLGLSLWWGSCALGLIGWGIWQSRKHLRIAAILLFGLTLLKLFLYDLTGLDGLSRTIAFIGLGILLLIISFLYTKYRDAIR